MFFVSLQLLGSVMSWIISRSSSAPLCLLFWSLKRPGDSQEGKMRDHMVVHLEDEEDFGNWMYTHYESDVDKEMGKTNDPSTTSPPHGNDSDGKHLKKILSKFDSTTDQIIENENDHFRSILEMIDNFQRPKCMEIVLGMVIIANKLAQVEVDRNKGYNCLWNVKPNQNLNGSPPQDVKIVEQFLRNIDQYVPGGPSAFSGIPASSEIDHSQKLTSIHLCRQLSMQHPQDDRKSREKIELFLLETLMSAEQKLQDQELQLQQVGEYIQSKYLTQVARVMVHTINHVFPAASCAISSIKDGTDENKIREVAQSTFSILCLLDPPREPLFPKLEGPNHSDSALSKGLPPTERPPHRRRNNVSFTCLCASISQVHEHFKGEVDA